MNSFWQQSYYRERFYRMTDAERQQVANWQWAVFLDVVKLVEQRTGRPFGDVTAELMAANVKKNPREMERLKRFVRWVPAWAPVLLKYLPGEAWLKDATEQKAPAPLKRKDRFQYLDEAWDASEIAESRHHELTEKAGAVAATHADHLMAMVADAELSASQHHLGAVDPVDAHIRECQIDTMVKFMGLLPTAGAAAVVDPMEDEV